MLAQINHWYLHVTTQVLYYFIMDTGFGLRVFEFYHMWTKIPTNMSWTPLILYNIFCSIVNLLFHCTIWRSLWKRELFCKLFNFGEQCKVKNLKPRKTFPNLQSMFYLLPYCTWALSIVVSLQLSSRSRIKNTLQFLFVEYPFLETCLTIACYFRHLVGFMEEFFILFVIAPFWYFVSVFVKEVTTFTIHANFLKTSRWNCIKQQYLRIRDYTDLVNEIIWPNVFVHTILNFVYFPYKLEVLKNSGELLHGIQFLAICVNLGCFYYLGADACRKVRILILIKK